MYVRTSVHSCLYIRAYLCLMYCMYVSTCIICSVLLIFPVGAQSAETPPGRHVQCKDPAHSRGNKPGSVPDAACNHNTHHRSDSRLHRRQICMRGSS